MTVLKIRLLLYSKISNKYIILWKVVVSIKQITLEFIGTGINNEFQAYIHIFDINGNLLYHKKTYNGKIILSLKGDEGYHLIAKSYNDKINTFFYVDKKHKKYTFIFNRSIYNPSQLRSITFLLKDANYKNLPIEKGEIFLCQKQ